MVGNTFLVYNKEKSNNKKNKSSINNLNNVFLGKTAENVRKGKKILFCSERPFGLKGNQTKWRSKINFAGEKLYDNFEVVRFTPKKVGFDSPIYLGFAILEFSNLFMNGTYYGIWEPSFGQRYIHFQYRICDPFVLSKKTKNVNWDLAIIQQEKTFLMWVTLIKNIHYSIPKTKKLLVNSKLKHLIS